MNTLSYMVNGLCRYNYHQTHKIGRVSYIIQVKPITWALKNREFQMDEVAERDRAKYIRNIPNMRKI